MTKSVNEREIVLAVLMEVTDRGAYSHQILRDVLARYQYLEKRERAFITRVTEGTLEHLIEIDYILDQFSKVKVKKMKPVIRGILRSSVYQLKYMDSVPDRAVCSEAVKLAARKGFAGLKGYVNGVLRTVARELPDLAYPADRKKEMSVRYSCPEWILELWEQEYGEKKTEIMLRSMQEEHPLTIRCCQSRVSVEELRRRLQEEGVKSELHPYLPYALCISGFDYLEGLETFREGLFAVQDVSSMLAGELADPPAGAYVLDVCAAPGGKALHVAEKLVLAAGNSENPENTGLVEAGDLTEYKTDLIEENRERLSCSNVEVQAADALETDESMIGKADIVIADLPCSGLGIIGKKHDIKYNMTAEQMKELSKLQRRILEVVVNYLKDDGILMYSTCTISREENIGNVQWMQEHLQLEPVAFDSLMPEKLSVETAKDGYIQLLPGIHPCDGFFIAKMRKKRS